MTLAQLPRNSFKSAWLTEASFAAVGYLNKVEVTRLQYKARKPNCQGYRNN